MPAERALAESLAGPDPERFHLVGEGVDPPPPGDAERFRRKHRVLDPFILYAGRKAAEKNTPLLVETSPATSSRTRGAGSSWS